MNRRRALVVGGAALGAAALAACKPGAAAGGASPTATTTSTSSSGTSATTTTTEATTTTESSIANTCVLTSELTQGPYWLDNSLVRKDITEGKSGAELTLQIKVVDYTNDCTPLSDAAVEIWHCDAWGYYSGYTTASPGGTSVPAEDGVGDENTYLRGILITDGEGVVEFKTIFPGWYSPRAVHIHCKVYTGGAVDATTDTYEGGTAHHTGQFFFADDLVTQVEAVEPYSQHTGTITTLDNDMVYTGKGVQDGLLSISGSVAQGFLATITVGVDPNYTSTGGGSGSGPSSGEPPTGEPPTGTPPSDLPSTTTTPSTTESTTTTEPSATTTTTTTSN